ncbi:MAG: hypothetical protein OXR66_08115 [Candidatus Woesearchaeota archaeon]|nr:hypothetical protein [Candidatus Woesearchaeota archaeon]
MKELHADHVGDEQCDISLAGFLQQARAIYYARYGTREGEQRSVAFTGNGNTAVDVLCFTRNRESHIAALDIRGASESLDKVFNMARGTLLAEYERQPITTHENHEEGSFRVQHGNFCIEYSVDETGAELRRITLQKRNYRTLKVWEKRYQPVKKQSVELSKFEMDTLRKATRITMRDTMYPGDDRTLQRTDVTCSIVRREAYEWTFSYAAANGGNLAEFILQFAEPNFAAIRSSFTPQSLKRPVISDRREGAVAYDTLRGDVRE